MLWKVSEKEFNILFTQPVPDNHNNCVEGIVMSTKVSVGEAKLGLYSGYSSEATFSPSFGSLVVRKVVLAF